MEIDSNGREGFTYEPTRIDASNNWSELSRSAVTTDTIRKSWAERLKNSACSVYARTESGAIWQWDAHGISCQELVRLGPSGLHKSNSNRWADIAASGKHLVAISTDSRLWIWEDGKVDATPRLLDDRPIWVSAEYANVFNSEGFLLLDGNNRIWRLPVTSSGELPDHELREFELLTSLPPTVALRKAHWSNSDNVVGKTAKDEYWVVGADTQRNSLRFFQVRWSPRIKEHVAPLFLELGYTNAEPETLSLFDFRFNRILPNDQYRDVEAIQSQIRSAISTLVWTEQDSFWRITPDGSVWAAPPDTATEFLDRDNTMRVARMEWTVPRFRNYRIGYLDLENGVYVNKVEASPEIAQSRRDSRQ